jgi:outer membrane protein assembly factor BamD
MKFSVRVPVVRTALAAALMASSACGPQKFTKQELSNNQSLIAASIKAERNKNWSLAATGFEQLTFNLPARDPILPVVYYHLGVAHQNEKEFILAAQAFSRVPENFPEDTLAPVATYQAGVSYAKLWRKPDLDSDYGTTAMSTFQSFLAAYPDSPLRDSAQKAIDRLNEMFAKKSLGAADLYAKERAWDSSIIYYKDVIAKWPQTESSKHAMIGLVKAYRAISYRDDALETCAQLHEKYPKDNDVEKTCPPPKTAAPAPVTPPVAPVKQ